MRRGRSVRRGPGGGRGGGWIFNASHTAHTMRLGEGDILTLRTGYHAQGGGKRYVYILRTAVRRVCTARYKQEIYVLYGYRITYAQVSPNAETSSSSWGRQLPGKSRSPFP